MLMENQKKKIFIIGAIVIIVIGGIIYSWIETKKEEEYLELEDNNAIYQENIIENGEREEVEKIVVHISGQIVNPGVITLEKGARIIDAIHIAGGITEEADLTNVNLAYVLEDAQKIYIPSSKDKEGDIDMIQENKEGIILSKNLDSKQQEKRKVNINTASQEELEKLPGIGSSIALRIVNYRKENGKFNTIEEIKNVSGIGENKFNHIKDNIYVK